MLLCPYFSEHRHGAALSSQKSPHSIPSKTQRKGPQLPAVSPLSVRHSHREVNRIYSPLLARVVNRSATIEFINLLWGRANRKPVIAADFLGDPTGTRVGYAISRCSGEVETSNASNASDPLQEDSVSAMVRKLVTIVGSGNGSRHRRPSPPFSPPGRARFRSPWSWDVVGNC